MTTATTPASKRRQRKRSKPQPFDFRRPTTLSREHVRAMQIVQETLARGFTTTLASYLRAVTNVTIQSIEQHPYDEYVRNIPNPTLITMLALPPLPGSAILQIPLRAAYAITELMLGGAGGANQPRRPMTDLELSLMKSIVEQTLPEIRYAFEAVAKLDPQIIGQEANPQFAQLAAPTDMVIVSTFEIRVESVTDMMTLCIPFSSLQPHLEELTASKRVGDRNAEKIAKEKARLHEHMTESSVVARALFRGLTASSRQLVNLNEGDVLLLNHPVEMPLTLDVGETSVFDVTIGRVNRHLALQVGGHVPAERERRRSRLQVVPAG